TLLVFPSKLDFTNNRFPMPVTPIPYEPLIEVVEPWEHPEYDEIREYIRSVNRHLSEQELDLAAQTITEVSNQFDLNAWWLTYIVQYESTFRAHVRGAAGEESY